MTSRLSKPPWAFASIGYCTSETLGCGPTRPRLTGRLEVTMALATLQTGCLRDVRYRDPPCSSRGITKISRGWTRKGNWRYFRAWSISATAARLCLQTAEVKPYASVGWAVAMDRPTTHAHQGSFRAMRSVITRAMRWTVSWQLPALTLF